VQTEPVDDRDLFFEFLGRPVRSPIQKSH
jgi:hypothetical protein